MLHVYKIATRSVSCHLTFIASNSLSLRRCTISHANSAMHPTPSLTDVPHLLTNLSDLGIWLRRVFELRHRFGACRLRRCGGGVYGESRLYW
jgi:hypothetical protein